MTHSHPGHDKFDSLAKRAPALLDPVELRARLLAAFQSAANAASAAAASVHEGWATAVHDSRKALRRGRALLWTMANVLEKSERAAAKTSLQQGRRSMSAIRDHAVAAQTLEQLPLSEADRDTAKHVLGRAAQAMPALTEIKRLLYEAATGAVAQLEALQSALPAELGWGEVSAGIRRLYVQARRARRAAQFSEEGFHRWRRRSRELAYTLAFVARQGGPRAAAIHREVDSTSDTLGPSVDLIMLREFVGTHSEGESAEAVEHLRETIDMQLEDLMAIGRKAGREAFKLSPKQFERRLTKAVERDRTIGAAVRRPRSTSARPLSSFRASSAGA